MQEATARHLVSLFPDPTFVLDVGCGYGRPFPGHSIGIDLDLDALAGEPGIVVQADLAHPLPLRDSAFDGVLAKDVIEHLERPRDLLEELARVARPGARLVVITPRATPRAVWDDYTHVRGFTKAALARLLSDSGWRLLGTRRIGGVPLAGRLGSLRPALALLSIPVIGHYYGTNWQAIATRDGPR